MARRKKNNFIKGLLMGCIYIALSIAIVAFIMSILPKNMQDVTIGSLGTDISDSLFITQPDTHGDDNQEDTHPTLEPTSIPTEETQTAPEPTTVLSIPETPSQNDPLLPTSEPETQDDTVQNDVLPTTVGNAETDDTMADAMSDEPEDPDWIADDIDAQTEENADETLVSFARRSTITISAAGDCTLGGDTTNGSFNRFKKAFDTNGEGYFFENVKDIFSADDLTIVNCEGALTKTTSRKDKTFSFRGDPVFTKIFQEGSVELVSLDNNHSQDYYSQGTADTKKVLNYLDIGYAGLGESYTTTIKGVKIGFLSYRIWEMSVEGMRTDIQTLKQDCDLVIVAFHWGEEKVGKASKQQIKLGHAAVDEGADLVIGHHPHVVGSMELYKGKYIVYSLGNFCFGGNSNPNDKDTFIFQQTFNFENGEITDTQINLIPCSISSTDKNNNYQPTPIPYDEGGRSIIKRIYKLSQQFAETETEPDWATILAQYENGGEEASDDVDVG